MGNKAASATNRIFFMVIIFNNDVDLNLTVQLVPPGTSLTISKAHVLRERMPTIHVRIMKLAVLLN
jgi:hypothetical protein